MVSLHEINEWAVTGFFLEGIIRVGGGKHYLQKVSFEILSIGGYGEFDGPLISPTIWIQSFEGKRSDIWYRLSKPAQEYHSYHKSFVWMAEMAKHTVDYLSNHQNVTLNHFRSELYKWLEDIYGLDESFYRWMQHYSNQDFRHIVASQANFLWCQATQVDEDLQNHPLWYEIHPRFLSAIPESMEQRIKADMFTESIEGSKTFSRRKTTVTPYVYECFKHLPWAKFLYCQIPLVNQAQSHKDDSTGYMCDARVSVTSNSDHPNDNIEVQVGDVVALPLDTVTTWKLNDTEWIGYVQSITDTSQGRQLGLLWLYRPSDTPCLKSRYPHSKELFLSDHCNCGDSPIYAEEIIRKPRVAFFGSPATEHIDFFVRQTYIEGDGAWQTLQGSDFSCNCRKTDHQVTYLTGDTLLVRIKKTLEPVIFVNQTSRSIPAVIMVRRLLRRRRDYGDLKAEPNELVFTNQIHAIPRTAIDRKCQIRFYAPRDVEQGKIPPPYNRHGTGDFYFITSQDVGDGEARLQRLEIPPSIPMNEGWDPQSRPQTHSQKPLRGLDIFCGGGNFGRGLEEGGAVHFNFAVDWNKEALHSYKANLRQQNEAQLFYGSVNNYLSQAMQGRGAGVIAQQNQVDLIAAGSPCQGFSNANPNKGNDRSLINVSMIASVVAFVDFYRPKYALMENVKGIAVGPDTENVLALVTSAFLGLGYQVRTFALDAWSYGSPQSRSRVFISIAAPGFTPLSEPPHTHSHPEDVKSAGLAQLANGLRSSSRYASQTPFQYISAVEATKDLPEWDTRTLCIRYPDHRLSRPLSTFYRVQISCVPRFPGGSTFVKATKEGYMPQPQRDAFDWSNPLRSKPDARGWQRVRRTRLMPTVLTEPRPDDGVGGTCLHWDEARLLTILEVRRAQGFPDDEVLVGLPREQYKIIGNSVARPVALALGLSLREAWLANTKPLQKNTENSSKSQLHDLLDCIRLRKSSNTSDEDSGPFERQEEEASASDEIESSSSDTPSLYKNDHETKELQISMESTHKTSHSRRRLTQETTTS